MNKYVIFIGGPTASGKTSMSISLAKHYQSEIISADSRQFYREISIGTAKPDASDRNSVKHHMIDSLDIEQEYSAGHFERDALELITQLHQSQDVIIVVGGTGLYHRAIYAGLDLFPPITSEDKRYHEELLDNKGLVHLQSELRAQDPVYAQIVDLNNPLRLIRALSVIKKTGNTFSSYLNQKKAARTFVSIKLAIDIDRTLLYQRINLRVDQMIEHGLIEEAKSMLAHRHLNSLNTVGYKELFKYFDGQWSYDMAIEKIKQHTRNYAKRQITWFNNQDDWLKVSKIDEAIKIIDKNLHS